MDNSISPIIPGNNHAVKNKVFSNLQAVFAILSIGMGFLLVKLVFAGSLGIAATIFVVLCSVFSIVFLKKSGIKLTASHYSYMCLILAFSTTFTLYSNFFIKFLTLVFLIVLYQYWIFSSCGNRIYEKISSMLFFEMIKSLFIMPFSAFSDCPSAISQVIKKNSRGKTLTYIAIGICITIPATSLIVTLLSQADEAFSNLFSYFFRDGIENVIIVIFQFLIGIPFAFYIYGTCMANVEKKNAGLLTPEKNNTLLSKIRFAPEAMVYTAVTPICLVYLAFFASQTAYFFSAFSSILPKGVTYAEYARRGFFELCGVIVINIFIILAMLLFSKREALTAPKPLKAFIVTLSVFTILLITTALSKMVMYIDNYGLTLKRVYTTWFMVLAGIIFILIIISQFNKRFNFMKVGSIAFVLMFALLCFSDIDAQIAHYNVTNYETGRLNKVDIDMMYNLSDSAVQYVAPLVNNKDSAVAAKAQKYIKSKKSLINSSDKDWRSFNLSTYKARSLLND